MTSHLSFDSVPQPNRIGRLKYAEVHHHRSRRVGVNEVEHCLSDI